jgi:HK97 family phage major capsid protein
VASYALEAAAADEQGPTFGRPEFIAKRAHASVTVSYEMAQDRPDLSSELSVLFQEAKDNLEEAQFATGVGTTVYPQGVALDGAFTAVTTATNDTTAVGDLFLVEAALPLRHRSNAIWMMTRKGIRAAQGWETAYGQLFNGVGYPNTGRFGRPDAINANTGLTLIGYPLWESPSIPWTPTTDATINGVLFNPDYYLILDRVGMSVKAIDMVNGATPSFPTGQFSIYAFWRNTARVIAADAGRQLKVQ